MAVDKEAIALQVNQEMDTQLVEMLKAKPEDRPKLLQEFEQKRLEQIATRVKAAEEAEKTKVENESKARTAFESYAKQEFAKLWANLVEGASKLETITGVTFQVTRDAETMQYGEPTIILGTIKKVRRSQSSGSGSGGGRGRAMTVNGKEYASASAAKQELLPDKADKQMSWDAVASALRNHANKYDVSE